MRFFWKTTIFGVLIVVFLLIWIFIFGISSNQPGSYFNKGHNAIWLEHKWVGEKNSEADIQALVSKLREAEIDTVFVHSGPIKFDGNIDTETYKYAVDFLDTARKYAPEIKYQAWLGQVRSSLDLSDPNIRKNIVKQTQILTEFVGFDGIHYDIEPVWDGDKDFINLLGETKKTLAEDKKMSVALAEFIPKSLVWIVKKFQNLENYNTEINYQNVAEYADQIVVMVYDTAINSEKIYQFVVKEQTIRTTSLLDGKEVFIAIPSYEKPNDHFNPEVENIKNGLIGIVTGLNNIRSDEDNFAGVSIYSYWETSEKEWKDYKALWLE